MGVCLFFWQLWDAVVVTGFNYISHKAPLLLAGCSIHGNTHESNHTLLREDRQKTREKNRQLPGFHTILLVFLVSAPRRDLLSELGEVSRVFSFKQSLVVHVRLTQVTPHGQITEAQNHRMFGHRAVSHHVLVNVTPAEHLVAGETDPVLSLRAAVLTRPEDIYT